MSKLDVDDDPFPQNLTLDEQGLFYLGFYHQRNSFYNNKNEEVAMMSEVIKNRYEFSLFFEVENGNPNGDPDAGNMPRRDAETGFGIVTDVCLKRKIRNYVDIVKQDAERYKIYVRNGIPLDINRKWAYEKCNVEPPMKNGKVTADEPEKEEYKRLTKFMCDNFYDIRAFGAVMTLAYNCGQVRGPVQLGFAKSVDIISPQGIGITSCTYANEGEKVQKWVEKYCTICVVSC